MSSTVPNEGWFEIVSLNVSEKTGTRKKPVERFRLEEGKGVAGDAHEGLIENRQVSFLAMEEIEGASATLCGAYGKRDDALSELKPGDFAENVTTRGVRLDELPLGTVIELGGAVLELSKIGKECHAACEIRRLVGDCVMPKKGVFARVVKSGEVSNADRGHYRIG